MLAVGACGDGDDGGEGGGDSAQSAGTDGETSPTGSPTTTADSTVTAGADSSDDESSSSGLPDTDGGPTSETDDPTGGNPPPGEHECPEPDPELDMPPCTPAAGAESEPNDSPSTAEDACLGGSFSGEIAFSEDIDVFDFTVPEAPYGGYALVSLTDLDFDATLQLEIRSTEDNGVIESDQSIIDGEGRNVWFAAEPGQSFRALVTQYIADPGAYTITMAWFPSPDCYEPNDERQFGKWIPVGEGIQAMLMAGYTDAGTVSHERSADWYRVQLEAGSVEVRVDNVPASLAARLELFTADGEMVAFDSTVDEGAGVNVSEDVAPGEYHILVRSNFNIPADGTGTDVPEHFVAPYTLTVLQ